MSEYDDISAALKAVIQGVANTGVVHSYRRWSNNWSDYLDLVDSTVPANEVRFWMVSRDGVDGESMEFGAIQRTHRMVVQGAMALDDSAATAATFQGLVDSVMEALDTKRDLGLSYVVDYGVGPCSARTIGEEALGDVLCHVVEISVPVVTLNTVVYS